jgi:hypothetical protein
MAKRTINLDTKDIELIIEALETSKTTNWQSRYAAVLRKMRNNLKTIKISSRKGKGRSLQKYICREIGEMIDVPYDQADDQCLIHSREMGQAGVDVILRGIAQERFPYCPETKATESLSIVETVQQAISNTVDPYDWLIVHKRKILDEPIVIISWSAFKRVFMKGFSLNKKVARPK